MPAQEIRYRNFDITLAALAYRFFMVETHTWEECHELIIKPTEEALWRFAAEPADKLVCVHSLALIDKLELIRDRADIMLVLPNEKVVYLGRVVSPSVGEYYPAMIQRDRYGISIPVTDTILTPSSCIDGARKYLQQVCPPLAQRSIKWLPDKISCALCEKIEYEALVRSRAQTDSEIDRILKEDA